MVITQNIRAISILQKIYSSQRNHCCNFTTMDNEGKRWFCTKQERLASELGFSWSQLKRLVKAIKAEHPGLLETKQEKKYIRGWKVLHNTVTYWHVNEDLYKELGLPTKYQDIYHLYEQLAKKTKRGRNFYPILKHRDNSNKENELKTNSKIFNKSYMEELKKIVERTIEDGIQHDKTLSSQVTNSLADKITFKNTKKDNVASCMLKILREEMPEVAKTLPQEMKYKRNICKYLNALFKNKYKGVKKDSNDLTRSFDRWRKYLQILKKNSGELLGVTTLTGVLIYDIISFRVANKVDSDPVVVDVSHQQHKTHTKRKIENINKNPVPAVKSGQSGNHKSPRITKTLEILQKEIGINEYKTWFKDKNVKFIEDERIVCVLLRRGFIADTIRNRYGATMKDLDIDMREAYRLEELEENDYCSDALPWFMEEDDEDESIREIDRTGEPKRLQDYILFFLGLN